MSNKQNPSNNDQPKAGATAGASGGAGNAPSNAGLAASAAATADIDAKKRGDLAKLAKCKPYQVLSFCDYPDRVVIVVQTDKTVEKIEVAL